MQERQSLGVHVVVAVVKGQRHQRSVKADRLIGVMLKSMFQGADFFNEVIDRDIDCALRDNKLTGKVGPSGSYCRQAEDLVYGRSVAHIKDRVNFTGHVRM